MCKTVHLSRCRCQSVCGRCVCSNCIKILLRTFNATQRKKKILPNVPSAPITQKRAEEKVQLVQLVLSQHICHFAGDVKITRNHLKKLKSQLNSWIKQRLQPNPCPDSLLKLHFHRKNDQSEYFCRKWVVILLARAPSCLPSEVRLCHSIESQTTPTDSRVYRDGGRAVNKKKGISKGKRWIETKTAADPSRDISPSIRRRFVELTARECTNNNGIMHDAFLHLQHFLAAYLLLRFFVFSVAFQRHRRISGARKIHNRRSCRKKNRRKIIVKWFWSVRSEGRECVVCCERAEPSSRCVHTK